MEVAPNQLIMERPHDREATQADVPEGGRLSVTCIAKGAKPQAYIYWNSNPELNKVCNMIMMNIFQFPMRTFSSDKWVGLSSFSQSTTMSVYFPEKQSLAMYYSNIAYWVLVEFHLYCTVNMITILFHNMIKLPFMIHCKQEENILHIWHFIFSL